MKRFKEEQFNGWDMLGMGLGGLLPGLVVGFVLGTSL